MGSKKKPLYDAEFREGAVRIVVETGKPVGDVAEELGINPGTLHSWVSRWRRNGTTSSDRPAPPAPPASTVPGGRLREAERAELDRLRREMSEKNKRIRGLGTERDVFKRCRALWVK
ncbi:transposase [Streptomyces sp. KMM 9044]|uniref:transposase n=1 Tax=Streptomyces sp. KMM 9044 TaxID=2744474 RepID=UPI002151AD23|nr:transposase [Streptomyces sp. KMM 9044]WAX76398.1 transposase [Streptomyces sp. KMM 9044]WAX79358.1 transposase [Streptomyces sp. KMM 9044]